MRGEEELPEGELGAATTPSGSAGTGGDDIKEEPRISAGSGRYLVAEPELLSMEFSRRFSWSSFENLTANAEFNVSAELSQ